MTTAARDDSTRTKHGAGKGLTETVRTAIDGERNDRLNWAAHKAGKDPTLDPEDMSLRLFDAAMEIGLPQDEAIRTIRSGINAGLRERTATPLTRVPTTAPLLHPVAKDGEPPAEALDWATIWATRHPRLHPLVEGEKYPSVKWQYPWADENRHPNHGPHYGMAVPPGTIVLDVDKPDVFAALGHTIYGSPAYQNTPSGGFHVGYRLHPDRPVPRQGTNPEKGYDTRVGGDGQVAIYGEDKAMLSDPTSWPFAPDFLQPPLGEDLSPLGTIAADELPSGPPPTMIANGWLHPEEGTCIYGKGGTGKGLTASYLADLLEAAGYRVLVADFENHPREWGTRLRDNRQGHGLGNIFYISPYSRAWTGRIGSLDQIADQIREECDRLSITYVIIDSYSSASDASADALGGQEAAVKFSKAMQQIGRPYLLLAHVNGAGSRHPERPFGSVHVHNLCFRRSWSVEEHEAPIKASADGLQPAAVSLEYRNQKHNDSAKEDDRFLTFEFWPGQMYVKEQKPTKVTTVDMILAVLRATPNMNAKQIISAIKATFPEADPPKENTIYATIKRHADKISSHPNKSGMTFTIAEDGE